MDLVPIAVLIAIVGLLILLWAIRVYIPINLWIACKTSGVPVSLGDLIRMRRHRIPPEAIVSPLIMTTRVGIDVSREQLEGLWLSGGDVTQVVYALVAANKADIPLMFDQAVTLQRQGHDVFQAVRLKIEPRSDGLSYSTRELDALEALEQTISHSKLV